ncbi:hypothetical protein BpHYR1_013524 [Brachionus plicatilis]|uniref:Uncharacterized protein n=1 Tax=Brachionus plicatilis TaxID=10195 RepID=A0A3M7SIR7_BRAPC|nr:hypothetical protein BpHYR1_013524 [Brachionus plicatilis]
MLGSRVVYLCDKAVQTDRESIDSQKSFYLDYYTCKEYNKKLVKKLNQAHKINDALRSKLDEIKINFDDGLYRKINEMSDFDTAEKEFQQPKLLDQNLVNELSKAKDQEEVKKIGNHILKQMDNLLEKSQNMRIRKEKMLDLMADLKDETKHHKETFEVVYKEFM